MWTSLPLEIRDAIAAHVFGSEDVVVGERLQNLLSLADLSPSFVHHAATLKQRSHVSAQAHEKAKRVAAERAARESAALRQQERVDFRGFVICFGIGQVAWALLVIGATPPIMSVAGQSIEPAVGDLVWWLWLGLVISLGLLLLVVKWLARRLAAIPARTTPN